MERYFTALEEPEFEDYIYLTEDLVQLKGNRYAGQRNQIHRFNKQYNAPGRVNIETITSDSVGDCMVFLQKWCDQRNCDLDQIESLACEKMATINALQNLDQLEAQGILIRVDGEVSAFGIRSHLTDDMGVLNFEKAFSNIKGLYQFLDNECARRLFSRYKYINRERHKISDGMKEACKIACKAISNGPIEKGVTGNQYIIHIETYRIICMAGSTADFDLLSLHVDFFFPDKHVLPAP